MKQKIEKFNDMMRGVIRGKSEKARTRNKVIFGGMIALLLAAFGIESTNNDLDLGTLLNGGTVEEAQQVLRTWTNEECVENIYNCEDFTTQRSAQNMFDQCGGHGNDVNVLDGDKDGEACEHLPKG